MVNEPKPLTKEERDYIEHNLWQMRRDESRIFLDRALVTVADLERQLEKARALLERRRAKLDWWEQFWEMARKADPGLHDAQRDRFEAEEG